MRWRADLTGGSAGSDRGGQRLARMAPGPWPPPGRRAWCARQPRARRRPQSRRRRRPRRHRPVHRRQLRPSRPGWRDAGALRRPRRGGVKGASSRPPARPRRALRPGRVRRPLPPSMRRPDHRPGRLLCRGLPADASSSRPGASTSGSPPPTTRSRTVLRLAEARCATGLRARCDRLPPPGHVRALSAGEARAAATGGRWSTACIPARRSRTPTRRKC